MSFFYKNQKKISYKLVSNYCHQSLMSCLYELYRQGLNRYFFCGLQPVLLSTPVTNDRFSDTSDSAVV